MRPLVIGAAMLLAGCDAAPQGADGYRFGAPEYEQTTFTVTLVQYDSRASFMQAARLNDVAAEELEAFSLLTRDRTGCEVHIERVATNYRPEWLGHEIAHCIHGRWHP